MYQQERIAFLNKNQWTKLVCKSCWIGSFIEVRFLARVHIINLTIRSFFILSTKPDFFLIYFFLQCISAGRLNRAWRTWEKKEGGESAPDLDFFCFRVKNSPLDRNCRMYSFTQTGVCLNNFPADLHTRHLKKQPSDIFFAVSYFAHEISDQ